MWLSERAVVGLGVAALIYGHLLRDWIFCRKLRVSHDHFNIIHRMRDPSQKLVFQACQIFWSVWFLFWVTVLLWPQISWKLFEPADWVRTTLAATQFVSFFLMNIARSSLESFDSWRVGAIAEERTALVTDGIYTLCRNPFVLFSLLQALSLLLLAPYVMALPLFVGVLLLSHRTVQLEELVLQQQHGARYRHYAARTARYLPMGSGQPAPKR